MDGQCFLNEINYGDVAFKMTLASFEALFSCHPFLFNTIGVKENAAEGMGPGCAIRVFCLRNVDANLWMLYAGIILHESAMISFFVTGTCTQKKRQVKKSRARPGTIHIRHVGAGCSSDLVSGFTGRHYKVDDFTNGRRIWYVPAIIVLSGYVDTTIIFICWLFYRLSKRNSKAAAYEVPLSSLKTSIVMKAEVVHRSQDR